MLSRLVSLAAVALTTLVLTISSLPARPAHAAWSASGNAVATASNVDETFRDFAHNAPSVCPDGRGGLIAAWTRRGQDSLMVQRLDHTGARQWNGTTGVLVSAATSDLIDDDIVPSIISDTDGGCWVAWRDARSGAAGIYVQHLDAAGVPQLTAGGLRVTADTPTTDYKLPLALTASKRLLVGWVDIGTPDTVQVQRVRTNGTLDWGHGLAVETFDGGLFVPTLHRIFADGEGVVALWEIATSFGGDDYDILYGNRFDATGAPLWGVDGRTIFNGADFQGGTTFDYSRVGGVDGAWDPEQGLWAVWSKVPGGVAVQRVSLGGTLQFGDVEVPVVIGTSNGSFDDIACTTDGDAGLIVGWLSGGASTSVFAQLVSSGGSELWGAGDVLVASGAGARSQLEVETDAAGGAFLVYTDTAPGANLDDVVVKRIDESGALLWTGLARTTSTSGAERAPDAVPDGGGGLLVVWEDDRDAAASTTTTDLYAKHFESDGDVFVAQLTLVSPNGGASYESMFPLPVSWTSNVGGEVALTYTSSGGAPVSITSATPNDGAFPWTPPPINSSFLRMQISIAGEPTITDESDADFRMCTTLPTGSLIASSVFTPYDVQTADLNEDGILDLAVAGASGISVLLGAGTGGVGNGDFGAPSVYAPGSARRVAVGDFDEDGILDLAVAHATGVSTLRGDGAAGVGDGTFAAPELLSGLASAADVIAADFDNDGVLDLVAADSVNNRVAVFRGLPEFGQWGDGSGEFASPLFFATGNQPMAVAAGDFEVDGDLDLAVANAGGSSVTLLRNSGTNGFGAIAFATHQTRTAPARPNAVMLYDFDGDQDADLLVGTDAGLSRDRCALAAGTPIYESWVDITGLPIYDMTLVDLGRNGIADVLGVGPTGAAQLFVAEGSGGVGNGTFTAAGAIGTGGAVPASIVSADFNEDGRPDLAFANLATHDVGRSLGGCNSIGTNAPALVVPDGGQVWTPNTLRTIQWTKPASLASVDLEVSRDGGASWEPIARRATGSQFTWLATHPVSDAARVRVRAHDYRHREDVSATDFAICGPVDSVVQLMSTQQVLDVTLLDLDRDGILDLAQVVSNGIVVRRGLGAGGVGDGHFGGETLFVARDSARAVARIDWDRALGEDLVLATDQGLEVWAAGATGRLERVFDVASVLGKLSSIAAGDTDADGDEDVVAGADSSRQIVHFRRTASGIGSVGNTPTAGRPSAIRLVDFDEDGDLDAIWTNTGGSQAVQKSFMTLGNYTSVDNILAGEAVDLAIADLNEDDIADIAVQTATNTQWLRGIGLAGAGNGTYATPLALGSVTSGRAIATGDWNADGRIDVLSAGGTGFLGGSVRVFHALGTGATANGTFAREELLFTGLLPTPLVLGDVREDDRLDLVTGVTDRTLVFLGACAEPPAPITLLSPVAGEAIQAGVPRDITWSKPATGHPVDLEYSADDGVSWRLLTRGAVGTRHRWSPPGPNSQTSRLRVLDSRLWNTSDATDFAFVIFIDPLDAGDGPAPAAAAFRSTGANPSRGATRFALTLPLAGEADVEIFDAAGRRIRTLLTGTQRAGVHALVWDGRDDGGRAQGPGVYLARARSGEFTQSRRFVRME